MKANCGGSKRKVLIVKWCLEGEVTFLSFLIRFQSFIPSFQQIMYGETFKTWTRVVKLFANSIQEWQNEIDYEWHLIVTWYPKHSVKFPSFFAVCDYPLKLVGRWQFHVTRDTFEVLTRWSIEACLARYRKRQMFYWGQLWPLSPGFKFPKVPKSIKTLR